MPSLDQISGNRRIDRRYEFEMPLRYSCECSGIQYSGAGRTKDLGRKSIRFVSDSPLPPATNLELRIEWPFLLQEVCRLELWVWGRVLRVDDRGAVVGMSKYEFRTCGERSFDQAAAKEDGWSIVA